jgi:hypothetical protein
MFSFVGLPKREDDHPLLWPFIGLPAHVKPQRGRLMYWDSEDVNYEAWLSMWEGLSDEDEISGQELQGDQEQAQR